ncbi:hypothetical protein F5882DRAFT_411302 [Hyaloscypha sp. PMI_1271]|nr:hypothetical protein F5882DRAFT_411302 [Hyaloscypha sp. PMI_1271]
MHQSLVLECKGSEIHLLMLAHLLHLAHHLLHHLLHLVQSLSILLFSPDSRMVEKAQLSGQVRVRGLGGSNFLAETSSELADLVDLGVESLSLDADVGYPFADGVVHLEQTCIHC